MSADDERIQISDELVNRLKNYMNDPMYKEAVENSSTYNERLVKERKLRLPFIDAQTGVAQSDCYIWSSKLDRMPGYHSAQLYSYPARRWRKKRRQYLLNDNYPTTNTIKEHSETNSNDAAIAAAMAGQIGPNGVGVSNQDVSTINMNATNYTNNNTNTNIVQNGNCLSISNNTNSNSALNDMFDDSKDSWLRYDDDGSDLPDAGELDDPESDYEDYEEYSSRKKKSKRKETTTTTSSSSSTTTTPTLKKKRSEYTDSEKPYQCELCGARYKTRPGLSYHYSHSHHENNNTTNNSNNSNSNNNNSNGALSSSGNGSLIADEDSNFFGSSTSTTTIPNAKSNMQPQNQQIIAGNHHHQPHLHHHHPHLHHSIQSSNTNHSTSSHHHHPHSHLHHSLNSQSPIPMIGTNHLPNNSSSTSSSPSVSATRGQINQSSDDNLKDRKDNNKQKSTTSPTKRASPSNYCDFCLGDSNENKKTQEAEDLVSCSDCGRSAHPSCLQFTPTMILSVKKYRWQCIECKSCGICGTSDNDDQLLFCDDCDRGYHMYCLKPPLTEPPEGSWSCQICIEEYHMPKSTTATSLLSSTTTTTTTNIPSSTTSAAAAVASSTTTTTLPTINATNKVEIK
ncbi:double PHD fingers d4 [Dermatophagoides pteronyssinus]|uniref:double PHD fingers d4 n=1 Tax=Dermatophagoides pteronyssinus TaxID=6956 RepID=UPI003F6627F2